MEELIRKAYEDGFAAGEARERGHGIGLLACWLIWRARYLSDLAYTRAEEPPPDPLNIGDDESSVSPA
jgi:hypothetical protein